MDITHGSFHDFGSRKNIDNSFIKTNESIHDSIPCRLELLSPDEGLNRTLKSDDSSEQFSEEEVSQDENQIIEDEILSNSNSKKNKTKKTRISDKAEDSDMIDKKMEEAIAKVKKLDGILAEKVQREKQVKRETLIYQKLLQSDLNGNKEKDPLSSDVDKNAMKFLALLPPPQQLDVLLERNDSKYPQPIFPTQINEDNIRTKKPDTKDSHHEPRPHSSGTMGSDKSHCDGTKRASSGSKCRSTKNDDKQDFIKRNIELVKEAGSYVQMTDDEKKRLAELLEDLNEEAFEESEMKIVPSQQNGYTPEPMELKRLQEIESNLQSLSSSCLHSTTNSVHSFRTDYTQAIQRISRSELTEAFNPNERMENIEKQLQQLDKEWKCKFDTGTPRLTNDQLQKLLDEESYDISSQGRASTQLSMSDISSIAGTERSDCTDVVHPIICRDVLDTLLSDARSSLGLNSSDVESNVSEISEVDSIKSDLHEIG
uniref:Fibrous sheath-interacting protein 1 n=1 Tax=Ciona savignyi TaxID=51511 RepID=H2ZNW9_CIOSA